MLFWSSVYKCVTGQRMCKHSYLVCLWDKLNIRQTRHWALSRLPQGHAFRKLFYAAGAVTAFMR